jgi:hypothetical protein
MDRTELINQLEGFRQACSEIGCIDFNNKSAFELEEAYPGIEPASYIIDVTAKADWINKERSKSDLRELIDLLYEKVNIQTRRNILTLRICEEERITA